ncbi:MAG: undecaprenyl-diphosphate phosphatase [Candidatus Acidiferrales bacterium]
MSLVQVIVLAVVQGLTEFLPISSTAHLILVPWLLGWRDQGLTFDIALHAGTLVAVLTYFAREWWALLTVTLGRLARGDWRLAPSRTVGTGLAPTPTGQAGYDSRLLLILAVSTIPAGLAGLFLEDYAENLFRSPVLIAMMLMAVAGLMWLADSRAQLVRRMESIGFADGLIIGAAQAMAVIPGTSRAGITIAAGLFRNLNREAAARFSFLLATPVIGGAALKKGYDVWQAGWPAGFSGFDFAVGIAVSAAVGYGAIAFLLRYLQVRTLKIFIAYRLALGVIILGVELLRSSP